MGKNKKNAGLIGAIIGIVAAAFTGGGSLLALAQAGIQGFIIGSAFGDTELPAGPQMTDKDFNDSSYGVAIPRLYGVEQVTGNIIWMENNEFTEVAEEVTLVESFLGDTTQIIYKYYATFAVALCEGTIDQVMEVYANDTLIYTNVGDYGTQSTSLFTTGNRSNQERINQIRQSINVNFGEPNPLNPAAQITYDENMRWEANKEAKIRFYNGSLDQLPDQLIVQAEGENAPAYRGTAYVLFENLLLTNDLFGNQIPKLRFVIKRNKTELLATAGDIRTFASQYQFPLTATPNQSGFSQYINIHIKDIGSVINTNTLTDFWLDTGDTLVSQSCYCFANGIAYTAYKVPPFSLDAGTKVINYILDLSNGTTVIKLNQTFTPYVFQTHSATSLKTTELPNLSESDPTYTTLLNEQVVYLYPWDVPNRHLGLSSHVIKPIQNLPGWVVLFIDKTFYLGKVHGDRFVFWESRVNLNEEFEEGRVSKSFNISDTASLKLASSVCQCFLADGYIYLYTTITAAAPSAPWFPGVVRIDASRLLQAYWPFPKPFQIARPELDFTGATNTFVESPNIPTYKILQPDILNLRVLDNVELVWNRDYVFTYMAFDYSTDSLYGIAKPYGNNNPESTFPVDNGKISTGITSNPVTLNQDVYRVYKIITTREASLDVVAQDKWISEGGYYGSGLEDFVNQPISLVRAYDEAEVWDFGYVVYKLGASTGDSYFVGSNSNSEITGNSILLYNPNATNGEAIPLLTPAPASDTNRNNYILPDTSLTGFEKGNIYCGYSLTSRTTITLTMPLITVQRQITTLSGNLLDLFTSTDAVEVGEVLAAEIQRAGTLDIGTELDLSGLIDPVQGLVISERGPIASTLKALQDAFIFDMIEEDYKIQGRLRKDGQIKRVIPFGELAASESGQSEFEFKITTPARDSLPAFYYITYRNADLNYLPDTVIWQDPSVSGNVSVNLQIPVGINQNYAYNLVRRIALATISSRLGSVQFTTSFKHSDLEVSDFVRLQLEDGSEYTVRIGQIDKGRPGLVKCIGVVDAPINYNYQKNGFESQVINQVLQQQVASPLAIDSLPFVAGQDYVGYWVGSYSNNFAEAFTSILNITSTVGETLAAKRSVNNGASIGMALNTLPEAITEGQFDYRSTLNFLPIGRETFTSLPENEVLADQTTNTFFYGSGDSWEMVKIATFIDEVDGTKTASGVLRGYKGTSHNSQHFTGDILVPVAFLTRIGLAPESIGKLINLTLDNTVGMPPISIAKEVLGAGRKPLPVININGAKQDNGDFNISWTRQTRHGIEWINNFDAVLDEDFESYRVYVIDITDGNRIVDTVEVTSSSTMLYNVARQTVAFGAEVPTLDIVIAQHSSTLNDIGYLSDIVRI